MEQRSRASGEQYATLLEFMERHGDLSKPTSGVQGRYFADRSWHQLGRKLNSIKGGVRKSVEKWKKVWADWKAKTKKKALTKQRESDSGEGYNKPGLTVLEERVVAILIATATLAGSKFELRPHKKITELLCAPGQSNPAAQAKSTEIPAEDVQYEYEVSCIRGEDEDLASTNMTSSDTYQLKWHSHSAHLNGSVAALLRSERFTDVVLCTMDGSQIPAHKFILSSCSVYLSSLFEGQRSVMRMGGMLYVVLPSEISTKALKILVEYMYKGETTVSNEVLDMVLKAGEVLKIRGLWRQLDEAGGDSSPAEKIPPGTTQASVNKQSIVKKADDIQPKIAIKKDDKVIKFNSMQTQGGVTRPMFIGPPKLVFIKTTEGGTQAALRPGAPLGSKGQTILVGPGPTTTQAASPAAVTTTTIIADDGEDTPPPRVLRKNAVERKYGKKQKTDTSIEGTSKEKDKEETTQNIDAGKSSPSTTEIMIKDEPEWDASSIEEEERSIAEMFQQEMNVKSEPIDEVDIDEDSLMYSPLACELCAEVFTVPAEWVRHVQGHSHADQRARKRKHRSASDDTEETMALLRCDLCQKHFPNPGEWVRHIQSTHTETDQ